ncbi:MAG: FAD binding domain-containing protein [Plesiomonas sp.]
MPKTLEEALALRLQGAIVFAGGTDLMVEHFRGSNTIIEFSKPVVHIAHLEALQGVEQKADCIVIGSATTFSDIIATPCLPLVLRESAEGIAGPPIRNSATIGGNICNASPSADSLPALYALQARLVLQSSRAVREVSIKDFIVGVGKTIIADDEILTHVILPKESYEKQYYRKVGTRKANALSKLAFCGVVVKEDGLYRFRLTFCTLGITITRSEDIEKSFATADMATWKARLTEILSAYEQIMKPRDSARSTAAYRKKTARNLIQYFIETMGV